MKNKFSFLICLIFLSIFLSPLNVFALVPDVKGTVDAGLDSLTTTLKTILNLVFFGAAGIMIIIVLAKMSTARDGDERRDVLTKFGIWIAICVIGGLFVPQLTKFFT